MSHDTPKIFLKPNEAGFRYVLMWMNYILNDSPDKTAAQDYVIEWRDFVQDCERELAELRRDVREWICCDCNTVYPGPPQEGVACVMCPQCSGRTAPRSSHAEVAVLRQQLDLLSQQYADLERSIMDGSHPNLVLERKAREEAVHVRNEAIRENNTQRERAEAAEATLAQVEAHLINLQPHIAQLPKEYQPFIDSHVDTALAATKGKK